MAIGITKKAADEIMDKLGQLFRYTKYDITVISYNRDIKEGVKGQEVEKALYGYATRALEDEINHFTIELQRKWRNKLNSLVAAYKSKDSELADALISKKS